MHLREVVLDQLAFEAKYTLIASYLARYAAPVNLKQAAEILPVEWMRYREIKEEIFRLMTEADIIANRLRGVVAAKQA